MDAPDDDWQGRVSRLEDELEAARKQHRIEREHDRLRHQEHALGLIIENEAMREKNSLLTKRTTRLKKRVEELKAITAGRERELRDALEALDAVYASRTWRAGRAVTRPARGLRR